MCDVCTNACPANKWELTYPCWDALLFCFPLQPISMTWTALVQGSYGVHAALDLLGPLLNILVRYLPPEAVIPVVGLIILILLRKDIEPMLRGGGRRTADGLYILHYAGYGRRITKQYNEASMSLEDHPLNLYMSFCVKRRFLIRDVKGEIEDAGDQRVIKTKALAEEMVKAFEEDHAGQPLDIHVQLGEKVRKVIDLILLEQRIKEMEKEDANGMLYQAYCRLRQARLTDPDLFYLYDHIRRDILENEEHYEALRMLRCADKDYVAMILNSIERGILVGKY